MKKISSILLILIIPFSLMSLIVRHDVPDERFIALGKAYPQVCHLSDGESTLIKENWAVTAAHAAILLNKELEKGKTPQVSIDNNKYDVERVMLHPHLQIN